MKMATFTNSVQVFRRRIRCQQSNSTRSVGVAYERYFLSQALASAAIPDASADFSIRLKKLPGSNQPYLRR
jgi:hypothetical protein